MLRRLTPSSLTGRLVAILVTVVLVTTVVLTVVTAVVTRHFLDGQLDSAVRTTLDGPQRYSPSGGMPGMARPPGDQNGDGDGDGPLPRFRIGDAEGTLIAVSGAGLTDFGGVITDAGHRRRLSSSALAMLRQLDADGRSHVVDLPGVGSYRVRTARSNGVTLVAGQSTRPVDDVVGNLVWSEALLGLGVLVVAVGGGLVLVRRQLRPLREVADTALQVTALPLTSGEIGTTVRVPVELTDERTEVGAVGAAINTMLAHVEHALDERHRSEQQVRQFVADASHELRTPLTTIHGYAELSRRSQSSDAEQLAHAMGKVESEATRMSSLVEDLLLLARLDAGRPLARDEVDLTKLVLETVDDARVVGPGHRWLLDLPDEEPAQVSGDEQRLHQVVTNLLNNARRHTPEGATVTVGVRLAADGDAGTAVLHVTDDGPGMSPELVDRAFERFTRGDSSRTRESGGAGLGLSLVAAIAHAHGGTVSVVSEPGRTRFEVRLPALVDALGTAHRL